MIDERQELDAQDTADDFNGEMSTARAKNAKGTLKRFFKDLMGQKWKIIAVVLTLAASAGCSVLSPKVLGMATDQILEGVKNAAENGTAFSVSITTMGAILFALIGLYLLSTLFSYIPQRILASVSQKFSLTLRKSISEKLNRIPLKYYDTHKKGEILSRVTSDLERVSDTLQETLSEMITAIITLIGAFVMMTLISPELTLIALGTVVVSMIVSVMIGSRTNKYYAANQAALGELNANIEESFTGNNLIKSFNLQNQMIAQNEEMNEKLRKAATKAQFITCLLYTSRCV